jgi:hypothetical protein
VGAGALLLLFYAVLQPVLVAVGAGRGAQLQLLLELFGRETYAQHVVLEIDYIAFARFKGFTFDLHHYSCRIKVTEPGFGLGVAVAPRISTGFLAFLLQVEHALVLHLLHLLFDRLEKAHFDSDWFKGIEVACVANSMPQYFNILDIVCPT